MANYELTVSMGYVPTWTHVDAVREIFQNAKDEETVNPENKMFFDYNEETETLMIGNKTGKLNKSTLLIGISDKRNDNRTIGQHGEGYKIATVVLLREGLSLKIYNFGCNEVWTAKKIKSRRYGVDIPAFDIQKAGSLLRPVANHDLVFEIQGITAEMYEEILESNLYLQEREGLLGEVMQANNSRMHFTDNDKEKLKENKRMIIEWITENIIPNMVKTHKLNVILVTLTDVQEPIQLLNHITSGCLANHESFSPVGAEQQMARSAMDGNLDTWTKVLKV